MEHEDRPPRPLANDPDNVSVRVIDGVDSSGIIDGMIAINLRTKRFAAHEGTEVVDELIMAARLRFGLRVARQIREHLDRHIARLLGEYPTRTN